PRTRSRSRTRRIDTSLWTAKSPRSGEAPCRRWHHDRPERQRAPEGRGEDADTYVWSWGGDGVPVRVEVGARWQKAGRRDDRRAGGGGPRVPSPWPSSSAASPAPT